MKARKVVTRSGRKFKGLFPSKKLRRMVEWESLLERDAILLFEFSQGIVSYQEQPEMIEYEQDGEMRKYYPDFSVTLKSGEIIYYEVKPASQLDQPAMQKKYAAIKHHYDSLGKSYRLLLDKRIRMEPRLSNLKILATAQRRFEDYAFCVDVSIKTIRLFSNSTVLGLSEFLGFIHVLALIGSGVICCDLNKNILAEDNLLRLPTEADRDSVFN